MVLHWIIFIIIKHQLSLFHKLGIRRVDFRPAAAPRCRRRRRAIPPIPSRPRLTSPTLFPRLRRAAAPLTAIFIRRSHSPRVGPREVLGCSGRGVCSEVAVLERVGRADAPPRVKGHHARKEVQGIVRSLHGE
jgi:hypothetical protein